MAIAAVSADPPHQRTIPGSEGDPSGGCNDTDKTDIDKEDTHTDRGHSGVTVRAMAATEENTATMEAWRKTMETKQAKLERSLEAMRKLVDALTEENQKLKASLEDRDKQLQEKTKENSLLQSRLDKAVPQQKRRRGTNKLVSDDEDDKEEPAKKRAQKPEETSTAEDIMDVEENGGEQEKSKPVSSEETAEARSLSRGGGANGDDRPRPAGELNRGEICLPHTGAVNKPRPADKRFVGDLSKKRPRPESSGSDDEAETSSAGKTAANKELPKDAEMQEDGAGQDLPAEKESRIPPFVIHDKEDYPEVYRHLQKLQGGFKSRNMQDGIMIHVYTTDDYRTIQRVLREKVRLNEHEEKDKYPHHSYRLREEKNLKVVIKGIPETSSETQMGNALKKKGYSVIKAVIMKSQRRDRKTKQTTEVRLPMMMVEVPREQKRIYRETELLGLKIRVEPLRRTTEKGQCYRCQRYGHVQSCCAGNPVCVRCGGDHRASECGRPREEPATCGNCGGAHPANYRRCPRRPQPKAVPGPPGRDGQRPKLRPKAPAEKVTGAKSFADAAGVRSQEARRQRPVVGPPEERAPPAEETNKEKTAEDALVARLLAALKPEISKMLADQAKELSKRK